MTDRPLRLIFMGTPDFAVPALRFLLNADRFEVVAVYTRAPKPKGRGHQVQKTPVHELAEARRVPVFTPKTLRNEEAQAAFVAQASELGADMAIVAAYGLILPKAVLEAPRLGCLNLHGSILPRWRGAAPIQRAILAGDAQSGVCLMGMEEGLDTGPVFASGTVDITDDMTAPDLQVALAELGARLLDEHLGAIASGALLSVPQVEDGMTYAAKIEKHEALIDWREDARAIDRKVRAFTPWPSAAFMLDTADGKNPERVKILAATVVESEATATAGTLLSADGVIACGNGTALKLETVQRAGRGACDGASFLRGLRMSVGEGFPCAEMNIPVDTAKK